MAEMLSVAAPGPGPGLPLLHRRAGWLLLGAVSLVHLFAMNELVSDRFGWGSGEKPTPRIEVAFVRELAQATPAQAPAVAPAAAAQRALPAVAEKPARPASAPAVEARAPEVAAPVVPRVEPAATPLQAAAPPEPMPPLPEPAPLPRPVEPAPALATAPVPPPAAAASTPALPVAEAFEWPPSTRLSYSLNGYYRGPIEGGRAQVDWLRSGSRYQVHLETSVGPMMSRRVTSDGELTERGLVPRRFEGEQKVLLRSPRRWALQFTPERITLADGREVDTQAGVQDEASQFVQLTWLFTTQPGLLQVGRSIDIPLALNRRVDRWIYDVKEEQTLQLPFGSVPTFYVKPRREAKGGEMTAEIWFAPTLQYLPVRILIRQDESTFVDLMLVKPPLQAAK
ncbi:MAG: DUF3108 domain-containing protein [Burkholderiales bacterium]|nr:DUF3108 domain-containing protein [Burkholderiales bacterium]